MKTGHVWVTQIEKIFSVWLLEVHGVEVTQARKHLGLGVVLVVTQVVAGGEDIWGGGQVLASKKVVLWKCFCSYERALYTLRVIKLDNKIIL